MGGIRTLLPSIDHQFYKIGTGICKTVCCGWVAGSIQLYSLLIGEFPEIGVD